MTDEHDTTPARAEAQDEGAAGERKSLIERLRNIDNGTVRERPWIATELCDEAANALEAHPSPTPAADADRVRIAEADAKWLTRWLGDQKEGGHCGEGNVERRERAIWNDRIDRILAALKSTAAKEGGK